MSSLATQGVLLVNLGTPDSPSTGDVRRYLREFLSDPRVIDIPAAARWSLLNFVILPFRPRRSAEAYRLIWEERGSPLLFHLQDLGEKLGVRLGSEVPVEIGMRYQNPTLASALDRLRDRGVDHVFAVLLFPQYSSAAWGSAAEELYLQTGKRWNTPALTMVPPFFDHPAFVEATAAVAQPRLAAFQPDHVLLSFHGLPERQLRRSEAGGASHCLVRPSCCEAINAANRNCYRAQSYATARAIAGALSLEGGSWDVAFQSRLGRTPWIQPFTDERIPELAAQGKRRLAVLCPSFVADCLETLEEIGLRARADFQAAGGDELELVPCVNSDDSWVEGLHQMLAEQGLRV